MLTATSGLEMRRCFPRTRWSSPMVGSRLNCQRLSTPEVDRWAAPNRRDELSNLNNTAGRRRECNQNSVCAVCSQAEPESTWHAVCSAVSTVTTILNLSYFNSDVVNYSSEKTKQRDMLVLYDFASRNGKELTVRKGDIVEASIRSQQPHNRCCVFLLQCY